MNIGVTTVSKFPSDMFFNMKCYYCLCDVCNLILCPYKPYDRASICYKRCYKYGFYHKPLLQCDFFVHRQKTKMYRVKYKNRRLYSEADVAEMLQQILECLKGDSYD